MRSVFLASVLLLCACRAPHAELLGGELRNRTRAPILDVRAVHQPTGRVVSVSQVLPGTSFQLGVAPRELRARTVTITWTMAGGPCQTKLEVTPPPAELRKGCWMVYSIEGPNLVRLVWERPPPSYRSPDEQQP